MKDNTIRALIAGLALAVVFSIVPMWRWVINSLVDKPSITVPHPDHSEPHTVWLDSKGDMWVDYSTELAIEREIKGQNHIHQVVAR